MKLLNTALIATTLVLSSFSFSEPSAREIMVQVDTRDTGDSSQGLSTMTLINKKGRERIRQIESYTINQPDVDRSVSYFLSPADVKGTGYLSYDYTDDTQEDDSWLYLPALKKVKRIAAGDKSGSFMGSDFSYSDLNGVNIDWYNYEILSASETVDGVDTWKIESTAKPEFSTQVEEETGYSESHLWIRKDNFVQVQAQIWVTKGKRVKYFSAKDIEQIDGIWTPNKLQMITTRNGKREHSTVLEINSIQYNQLEGEELFTTSALQRGL
ncbi:outer membrane lipoprotein-sorting protein [Reinekea sp.]|uniref:outer membrane lipoprotein-sorting protein n=1 Tax=Reinekea sp. TaxID=1970455 RepID=UPI002A8367D0|nr:outer membrane lipoprotein-sorting protein [Reinekea sp.]